MKHFFCKHFLKKIYFDFMCICMVRCVCVCVCVAYESQKRALDFLKQELKKVVSYHIGDGNQAPVLCSVEPVLFKH